LTHDEKFTVLEYSNAYSTFFIAELEDWLSAIKPLCVPQMVRSPKVAKLREVRTLHLAVSEAHRLPLKLVPNPYFVVTFNQVITVCLA
jgi:Ras GTPase-activating protein 1